MTKFYAFRDTTTGETFAVWASSEMLAWDQLYGLDPAWADTQVSLLGEISYEEQKGMKQVL